MKPTCCPVRILSKLSTCQQLQLSSLVLAESPHFKSNTEARNKNQAAPKWEEYFTIHDVSGVTGLKYFNPARELKSKIKHLSGACLQVH